MVFRFKFRLPVMKRNLVSVERVSQEFEHLKQHNEWKTYSRSKQIGMAVIRCQVELALDRTGITNQSQRQLLIDTFTREQLRTEQKIEWGNDGEGPDVSTKAAKIKIQEEIGRRKERLFSKNLRNIAEDNFRHFQKTKK
jgi:hypothetical protein